MVVSAVLALMLIVGLLLDPDPLFAPVLVRLLTAFAPAPPLLLSRPLAMARDMASFARAVLAYYSVYLVVRLEGVLGE